MALKLSNTLSGKTEEFRPLESPLRLLYVGRVNPAKGTDVVVATLAALARRDVAATLTIAGPIDDPGFGAEVRARAAECRW